MITEITLPVLREDLRVETAAPGEDGAPAWLLYDPLKNNYYRMGQVAFVMLSNWRNGALASDWLGELRGSNPSVEQTDLEQFFHFLFTHNLTLVSSRQDHERLLEQSKAKFRGSWFKWLFTHYLFLRVPLIRPDSFLAKTLPYVDFVFGLMYKRLLVAALIIGVLLVIQQWDVFLASLLQFFNLKGAIFFAITLFFVKVFHELGHAYMAKRQGCRVPTMGVAFLVLYPFLYTDTTDAWRLQSRKRRLAIVTAGVKAELALAIWATFFWSFLDVGVLKSCLFFVATTSWITSLGINMSPFMRFDGYYALADWLRAENLQQRAFVMARWRLRKLFFGLQEQAPEALSPGRQKIFLLYAYSTWVYRLFLFFGIALLVYHLSFKILGIVLFIVEIIYFIIAPIMTEMKVWWKSRAGIKLNYNLVITVLLLLTIVSLLFAPWQQQLRLPGVLVVGSKIDIYPTEDAQITKIHISRGQKVKRGELLFSLISPGLIKEKEILNRQQEFLETQINRFVGSAIAQGELVVQQRELAKINIKLKGVEERIEKGDIRSPKDGYIATLQNVHQWQWVSRKSLLTQITGEQYTKIISYIEESQLHLIKPQMSAIFIANSGDLPSVPAQVESISAAAVSDLKHRELSSTFGGAIPVRVVQGEKLHPEHGMYMVNMQVQESFLFPTRSILGQVNIKIRAQSPFASFWRYGASVLIRESGI